MEITWKAKSFNELTTSELYKILALRTEVFVVEQDCVYQDLDGKDQVCILLWGEDSEGNVVATTRIVPKKVSYPNEISIGRVATSEKVRGLGLGKELMKQTHSWIEQNWGKQAIRISAQEYLLKFYSELGYQATEKKYLEDGIPHVEMVKI